MLIQADEAILMEPDEDLALTVIGGPWREFKKTIPEVQAKVLVDALNLILLTDSSNPVNDEVAPLDADAVIARPSTLVPYQISNLLVDEMLEISEKKLRVYEILLESVLNLVRQLGFTINEEMVQAETLPAVCKIGHFLFEVQGYQDLIGMAGVLESRDIDPVERYIMCLEKYYGEDFDSFVYYEILDDVSEVTLQTILNDLSGNNMSDTLPDSLIERVQANKVLLDGTLAWQHIRLNGQLGGSIESFLAFFQAELEPLTQNLTGENTLVYLKELAGFYLISDVNSPQIKERLSVNINNWIDDPVVLMQAESFINKLVLDK